MNKRRLLGASLVGAFGTLAAANRVVRQQVEPLSPPLGREMGTWRWRGLDVAYTEAGDPEDPDMMLLHGIHAAATSREFNRIYDRLADDFHVFAPDFPGFGRSDRPPLTYTAAFYEAFVRDFITDLTDHPTCVATSLSGAYAAAVGTETDMEKLVLVCPTTTTGWGRYRPVGRLFRTPLLGTAAFNVFVSYPAIRATTRSFGVYDPEAFSEMDESYFWQTAHQPGAKHAAASFVSGYLDSAIDIADTIAESDIETTLIWGRESTAPPLYTGRKIAEHADAKLVVIDRSRVLPYLEQPDPFLEVLTDEMRIADEP